LSFIHEDAAAIIRDITYAASWDKRDLPYMQKLFAKIRYYESIEDEGKVLELVENDYERKISRVWNGQYVQDTPDNPRPMEAVTTPNILTSNGMALLARLFMIKTTLRYNHYASGNGTTIAQMGDIQLQSEQARIGIDTDGFDTPAGTIARWGAIFIPTFPSHVISEAGVFNAASGGTMLNRTVYPSTQRITHTIFVDFYTLSISVSLTSV
jgi:hypothetical protein